MRMIGSLFFLILIVTVQPLGAMTRIGHATVSKDVTATGFFGGIRSGTTLVLNLSEQGGLLYFKVDSALITLYRGQHIEIARLPVGTPIAVTTVKGTVTAIKVQKGE